MEEEKYSLRLSKRNLHFFAVHLLIMYGSTRLFLRQTRGPGFKIASETVEKVPEQTFG